MLKHHIKDCFKTNGKQKLIMPKKYEYDKFKNYELKIKSSFIICTDFESNLVLEDNRNQDPNESYTNKCQTHIAYSYGYKLALMISLVSLLKHT